MHKLIILFVLFIIASNSTASDLINITAFDGKTTSNVKSHLFENLYGKAVAHLLTCGNARGAEKETIPLSKFEQELKNTKHFKISFNEEPISIPVGKRISTIDEIFILYPPYSGLYYDNQNTPIPNVTMGFIYTRKNELIQSFSKCSGHSAINNLTCNQDISNILSIPKHPKCQPN